MNSLCATVHRKQRCSSRNVNPCASQSAARARLELLGEFGGIIPRFVLVAFPVFFLVLHRKLPKCHSNQISNGFPVTRNLPNVSNTINWRRILIFRFCFFCDAFFQGKRE